MAIWVFDEFDVGMGDVDDTGTAADGTVGVVPEGGYGQGRGVRSYAPGDASSYGYAELNEAGKLSPVGTISEGGTLVVGFRLRLSALLSSSTAIVFQVDRTYDGTPGVPLVQVYAAAGGNMFVNTKDDAKASHNKVFSGVFSAGSWYSVVVWMKRSVSGSNNGWVKVFVRLDGDEGFTEYSHANLESLDNDALMGLDPVTDRIRIGNVNSHNDGVELTVDVDEVWIGNNVLDSWPASSGGSRLMLMGSL